jgi:hypothetical protein
MGSEAALSFEKLMALAFCTRRAYFLEQKAILVAEIEILFSDVL